MINFLKKLMIKNEEQLEPLELRNKYGVICGIAGIIINIFLFIIKFIAGIISNSIAISADAFNNLGDVGSSVITLLGFKLSSKKADPDHPFGHGRIEYISGLIVSMMIILMGFELFTNSVKKVIHPEITQFNITIAIILIVSIVLKIYIYSFNIKIGKKINSSAMIATAKDSLSDTISTITVLLSGIISYFTTLNIDGYVGVLVSIFIFYSGIQATIETINPLLGQAPEREFVEKLMNIVNKHEYVLGTHDLIVHDYGPGRIMISLHVEVPADGNILEMHDEIDNIEKELKEELKCSAVVHMDPVETQNSQVDELKTITTNILSSIDKKLSMHDFRIVPGSTHTNILFDVVIPYDFQLSKIDLYNMISKELTAIDSNFCVIIDFDVNYINID